MIIYIFTIDTRYKGILTRLIWPQLETGIKNH